MICNTDAAFIMYFIGRDALINQTVLREIFYQSQVVNLFFFLAAPRECIICGDLAYYECKECYNQHGAGLNTIAFCEGCKDMVCTIQSASNDNDIKVLGV